MRAVSKYITYVGVLSVLASCGNSLHAVDSNAWSAFVFMPNVETRRRVALLLQEMPRGNAEFYSAFQDNRLLALFIQEVEARNDDAIDVAFEVLDRGVLSGGNLQDLLRAAALVFESAPKRVLMEIKNRGWTDNQIGSIVGALPESVVDDNLLRKVRLKERRNRVLQVHDEALKTVRARTLVILNALIAKQ